jgi:gas vesicle protein
MWERIMNNTGKITVTFLVGLGVGVGLALLFAPQSGEETREWIAETAEDEFNRLRRKSRQTLEHLQDAVSKGEEKVAKALRTGKNALESVASKLD